MSLHLVPLRRAANGMECGRQSLTLVGERRFLRLQIYPGSWGRLNRWKGGHTTDPEERREHDIFPTDSSPLSTSSALRQNPKPITASLTILEDAVFARIFFKISTFCPFDIHPALRSTASYLEIFSGLAVHPHTGPMTNFLRCHTL